MLRALDPAGLYDYNHLYLGGGELQDDMPTAAPAAAAGDTPTVRGVRVGLIDTGIDGAPGLPPPAASAHGAAAAGPRVPRTAPPSPLSWSAARRRSRACCPQRSCTRRTFTAASRLAVRSMPWSVPSAGWRRNACPSSTSGLVGPPTRCWHGWWPRLVAQGFLLVAAVGNDGPAAPPLYPAVLPGVVGVTAVDAHLKVLIEAARGPQVMFAAFGADLATAAGAAGYARARGTSFASPVVAALLATQLTSPAHDAATAALEALSQTAIHPGHPGRDLTYGFGVVGAQYRNDPPTLLRR